MHNFICQELNRISVQTLCADMLICRLKDYLQALLDEKETDAKWIERMPEDILVKNAVPLFELSVSDTL